MVLKEDKIGHLEEEARKRKERLAALKHKRKDEAHGTKGSDEKSDLPKPIFRSYRPTDEKLKEAELPNTAPADIEDLVQKDAEQTIVDNGQENLDVGQLEPRKPDWDLKRDLAPKLERLERRTQRAIVELVRQRLALQPGVDNLVAAVATASRHSQQTDDNL